MLTSSHNARQNKRKKQIIIKKRTKRKWINKSLTLERVQKWSKLPTSRRTFNSKACFKKILTYVLLDQHKTVPFNRQIEPLNPILPMRTNSHNLNIILLRTMLVNLFNILKIVDI